ncbi:helix-turn-helix domain-containing protein [uncultured Bacteroides sp.]|uniref:AraC family transcriptional regulator n=1 Tax=uncultured Bacteroides sp. TaxID=162156 RepID=UPI002676C234|nr:helix-turn-helix domain-containing protein [uncultured Bacteroides sp.]
MGILYLSVELTLDLIALVTGIILIIHAKDNYPKLYWGIIATGIGIMFSWENIGWLTIVTDTPEYNFTELLNIEKMLKWYALANIVALFPLASLSPGYFNHFRIFTFLLPPIIIITVGICYLGFNGTITSVSSLNEIMPNINHTDIKVRICIFLFSVLTPLFTLVYAMFSNKTYRRINNNMYLFIGFLFLFLGIYILFTLNINEFIFNLFGITAIVFTVLFSILYLRHENPFSDHIEMVCPAENAMPQVEKTPRTHPLFPMIEAYLKEQHPYINKSYTIELLAKSLNENEHAVSTAIKSKGFTGFREYINYLRLEHFRRLATEDPGKNVKELMYACGFTSRATFYRIFSEKYGISPARFIDNQRIK